MDLGSKIRKYRTMHGMTQNELGVKIGFSSATADSRIRKYEANKMVPKEAIRKKLVEALDVDESALTDIDIQTFEDMMQAFFLFEEKLGMDIEVSQGKTSLTFDHSNKDIELLLSYLLSWYLKKQSLPDPEDPIYALAEPQYRIWKSRFPKDLKEFWREQKQMVAEAYAPIMEELLPGRKEPEKLSDLIRRYKEMVDVGILFKADHRSFTIGDGSLVLSFPISELMEIKDSEAGKVFAEFLCDLQFLEGIGMRIYREVRTTENGAHIFYVLRHSPLSPVAALIEKIQKYKTNKDQNTEWDDRMFRFQYEEYLQLYNIKIEP